MDRRLAGLGVGWGAVITVDVYTPYPPHPLLADVILRPVARAAAYGVHSSLSHLPIAGLVLEMDVRGVRKEIPLHDVG